MTLTNQELIQELQKRIKEKTLRAEIIPDRFEEKTNSLISLLDGKNLLLVLGLTIVSTLTLFYCLKATSRSSTGYTVEFDNNLSLTVSSEIPQN